MGRTLERCGETEVGAQRAVGETTQQSAVSTQIIATIPALEKLGEAKPTATKPTEANGVAATGPKDAEDAPVEAIQPNP